MTSPPPGMLAGQRPTVDRINVAFLTGRLVFAAYRDTAQSISSTTVGETVNALSWDNVVVDLLGGWSVSTPTRYTPPIAGWYHCIGSGSIDEYGASSGTLRGASWRQNGSLPPAGTSRAVVSTAIADTYVTVAAPDLPLQFNGTSDYLELCPFQNSGASINTATGSVRPSISLYYAGPA
ncbi:hypothetical protein RM780_04050 [Streptomyces sp. DSM 44917]|uniref:Uncharacterized protein n=1 Tax=Streptomyces boetiae TaxID=3075541 RepID=A0ABU2L3N3_9ACTN|nr:hypothetical protein [Streptomyces sp. DSM 44917]MDT0306135.1 hypothetical protein [Streptomyces sp. DSM 44917]